MLTSQLQLRRMQRAWRRKGEVVRMLVWLLVGRNRIEMEEGIGRIIGRWRPTRLTAVAGREAHRGGRSLSIRTLLES